MICAVDVDQDLGHRGEGRDRDLVADLDGGEQLGEIRVLANLYAVLESEGEDALGDRAASARHHPRRVRLGAVVAQGYRDGGLLRGWFSRGQKGVRSAANSTPRLEKQA